MVNLDTNMLFVKAGFLMYFGFTYKGVGADAFGDFILRCTHGSWVTEVLILSVYTILIFISITC